jgi:ABC-type protease/lipase transport system fused ATPase/permease subunit
LAPVDLAIAHWKSFVAARQSWHRLNRLLEQMPARTEQMQLQDPSSRLAVEAVSIVPPGDQKVIVQDVTFALEAGHGLGVIGPSGSGKSSLARALYGDPFLIVLDEPNSNLDTEGDEALTRAVRGARERGAVVVVVAHRPVGIEAVDQLLVLKDGRMQAFGPKEQVLGQVLQRVAPPTPIKIVSEGGVAKS